MDTHMILYRFVSVVINDYSFFFFMANNLNLLFSIGYGYLATGNAWSDDSFKSYLRNNCHVFPGLTKTEIKLLSNVSGNGRFEKK